MWLRDIDGHWRSDRFPGAILVAVPAYVWFGSATEPTIGPSLLTAGLMSALTVVLVAPYAYYIPKAGLAGILMLSAWRLVDRQQLAYYLRTTRFDAWIVLLTAVSAVAVSVEFCILIGVLLSFVLYVPQAARAHLTELVMTPERVVRERSEEDVPCSRIRIFSLEGELFFGASDLFSEDIRRRVEQDDLRVVIVRLKGARHLDATTVFALRGLRDYLARTGRHLLVSGVHGDALRVFRRSGLFAEHGFRKVVTPPNMVGAYYDRLGLRRDGASYCLDVPAETPG